MEYQDQPIICSDCGQEFIFTAGEQQFYAERGFDHPPKRCKPCRTLRKQQQATQAPVAPREAPISGPRPRQAPQPNQRPREAASRSQAPREPVARMYQPRDVHVTTCQACGVTTRVPFKPQEGRGVYCPECYQA
ncbi:MAG: zinc-ribbon domain containing protein, partial [Candidatus Tectimicrobiota bacterium]